MPCSQRGCGSLVEEGYCDDHKSPGPVVAEKQRQYFKNRFYDTESWRNKRDYYLEKNPLCNNCGDAATEVDHIVPLRQGGDKWDDGNLQSLCKPCHGKKTAEEVFDR